MLDTQQGNIMSGPVVEPIGYKRIVTTMAETGEIVDADLYIYSIGDTKSDSVSGKAVRYYEGCIKARPSETSIDSDRVLSESVFELTAENTRKIYEIFDTIVQGSSIELHAGDTVMTGSDIVYYYQSMMEQSQSAADYIKSLTQAGAFEFDADLYNHNIYDATELRLKVEASMAFMRHESEALESALTEYGVES